MTYVLDRERKRLDAAYALVSALPASDEVLAHWARYLCVLTAGFVEECMRLGLADYVEARADRTVSRYAQQQLGQVSNLNEERLGQLLGLFSADWLARYRNRVSQEDKSALDSILANRNNIAHGRQVGITVPRMRDYYARVCSLLVWIYDDCLVGT